MLIEREEPLEELLTAARLAGQGHGCVAIVAGEAGIGKTSLLRRFASVAQIGERIYWGGCEALFTPRPLGPLQDMAAAISARLGGLFEHGAAQDRLFPALLEDLQNLPGTSVLIFEDVHWADNATLDLIKYLGRRIPFLKVALVLSMRTDEITTVHPIVQVLGDLPAGSTKRIDLKPLSQAAVAALLQNARAPIDELYRITNGNPFFVTELLAKNPVEMAVLPASIRDAVWSRMSRLTRDERALLQAISIVPGAIDPRLVQALQGDASGEMVDRCLDYGVLVKDHQGFLIFRHELARQATLDGLSNLAQKSLHSKLLAILLEQKAGGINIPLSSLVHHAAGAGDGEQVLSLAPQAASEAARLGAHVEAAAHLATALRYASRAPKEIAAQLNEDWAYEAGLAVGIDDSIIAARTCAIELWRELRQTEKVALNLRWLSRLHWYRGEAALAKTYIEQALSELESVPPGPQLAMALSARSQMFFLHGDTDNAIDWGLRAITLAEQLGETETRIHALNNVGSARLFSGRPGGRELMEESLALALKLGFHEQAARAYTNFAEYAVVYKEFALAERLLAEGIAFDTRHDLDSWTHYLVGRQAQLRMEQGRLREAEVIAEGVRKLDRLTLVMRLPALTVLGRVRARLGEVDALAILESALQDAVSTEEMQNIAPVRFGLIEAGWLTDNLALCEIHLNALASEAIETLNEWEIGELAVWWRRCGMERPFPSAGREVKGPRAAELRGETAIAAAEWSRLGLPYEAALTLSHASGQGAADCFMQAVTILDSIEANAAASLVRNRAKKLGFAGEMPKSRRGPYKAARANPLSLTGRELQILGFLAQGASNGDIARDLGRSPRTIEHHVTALLAKLNAKNRMDVLLRLQSEPWLLPSADTASA